MRPSGLLSAASPIPHYARRYPLSYVLSGFYGWYNSNLLFQGEAGYWWSATAYSTDNANSLTMNSSNLTPFQDYRSKPAGFPLH